MKWIIDRFEEDDVVIECMGQTFNVPACMLPTGAKEGDEIILEINKKSDRREQAVKLMNKVFKK